MIGAIVDPKDITSLATALDLARVGVALWDRADRLVAFNDAYRVPSDEP